ncbi:hypothetical protein CEK71_18340 [Methylovulum psychrotolerans]|uniref:Uncharacterized protein n=1 Tax=Methylovulum psychrotolerans TaxID=1704499 RepID=A0A1Z4C2W4_9GAMM|nr:hypothetical protein CEK71_18340 [Methylovulum psychrotolerans]
MFTSLLAEGVNVRQNRVPDLRGLALTLSARVWKRGRFLGFLIKSNSYGKQRKTAHDIDL